MIQGKDAITSINLDIKPFELKIKEFQY